MNIALSAGPIRKLPSADWLAVGLAMLGLFLSRFSLPLSGVLGMAVFGPSVLRELGLLRDTDEWLRSVMHRAGFHAAVTLSVFIFLGRVLPPTESPFQLGLVGGQWFGPSFLWQTLVMVFLVSYLIQYWGSIRGSARILVGFGGFLLLDGGALVVRHAMWAQFWPLAITAGLMMLLGWAAVRWPRVVGGLLLLVCLVPFIAWLPSLEHRSTDMLARLVASMVHIALVFGVTGAVLVSSGRRQE